MNNLEKILVSGVFDLNLVTILKELRVSPSAATDMVRTLSTDSLIKNLEFAQLLASPLFQEIFSDKAQKAIVSHKLLANPQIFSYLHFFSLDTQREFLTKSLLEAKLVKESLKYIKTQGSELQNLVVVHLAETSYLEEYPELFNLMKNKNDKDRSGTPYYFKFFESFLHRYWSYFLEIEQELDLTLRNARGFNLLEWYVLNKEGYPGISEKKLKTYLSHSAFKNSRILPFYNKEMTEAFFKERWEVEQDSYPLILKGEILNSRLRVKPNSSFSLKCLAKIEAEEKVVMGANLFRQDHMSFLKHAKKHNLRLDYNMFHSDLYTLSRFYTASTWGRLRIHASQYRRLNNLIKQVPELAQYVVLEFNRDYQRIKRQNLSKLNIKKVENVNQKIKEIIKASPKNTFSNNRLYKGQEANLVLSLRQTFRSSRSVGDLALALFGKNTGYAQNLVNKRIINAKSFNPERAFWCQALTAAGYNYDLVTNLALSRKKMKMTIAPQLSLLLKDLKRYVPETRVISWIEETGDEGHYRYIDSETFVDTLAALSNLAQQGVAPSKVTECLKDAKSFEDVHDLVGELVRLEVEQEDYFLHQEEIAKALNQKTVGSKLQIYVPQMNCELIKLGSSLDICVGDGGYGEKVISGDCFIISLVDNKNKPVYCVELTKDYGTVQCRGKYNSHMEKKLIVELSKVIMKSELKDSVQE